MILVIFSITFEDKIHVCKELAKCVFVLSKGEHRIFFAADRSSWIYIANHHTRHLYKLSRSRKEHLSKQALKLVSSVVY